jgi:hypothetical protein
MLSQKVRRTDGTVKNPVLPPTDVVGPHGASSKEKAILAIHPRSSERGILAFSRKKLQMQSATSAQGTGRTAHGKLKITKTLSLVP